MPSATVRPRARDAPGPGHESDVYALTIDDDLRSDVRPFADPGASRGDITIFHFALPSPMTAAFARLDGVRVLQYHNITPAAFFAPYSPALFRLAALGRRELASLVGQVDLALGDSEFNRLELEALGFSPTGVVPIAVDTDRITRAPRRPALEKILGDGLINILFVGRMFRNKRIDDHIRLAEVYKRIRRQLLPVHLRRPLRRRPGILCAGPGAHRRIPDAPGSFLVHGTCSRRGPRGVLPLG
jgi:glycosyltransferase involved in cell wall biosynthesis